MATCLLAPCAAHADQGRFDLLGPNVDVHVTRGDRSLPIANVPNLQTGDKLLVHADLPASQSVHLLLVVVFLRGTTNPPPDNWFTRIETWNKKQAAEGVTVKVPDEAQQALIFIAPETGGDFSTLKSAVQGRPGTFVRAVQDLNQASFEQSRIEHYVQALQRVKGDSSAEILDHSRKLAATLNLKPNDECFKRPADEQVTCLQQTGASVLLDDGHGQTLAQQLTSGDSSNLIGAMQGTPVVANTSAAAYSAYVGTVLDLVRLMTGLHTAHFQYIPAIAFPNKDALNLRLNTAPSFHNPKSVIVIALPAIHKAVPPPLQLADPAHVSCLLQPHMVLPLVGAPLVFATGFAHDLVLHLDVPTADGRTDLPLVPDAFEGGLIVADSSERKVLAPNGVPMPADAGNTAPGAKPVKIAPAEAPAPVHPAVAATPLSEQPIQIHGTVHGFWGFDAFTGPTVPLQQRPGTGWTAAASTEIFTGRSNSLLLHATGTGCVQQVQWIDGATDRTLEWHTDSAAANTLVVKLPLEKAAPGGISLQVKQFGDASIEHLHVTAYSDVTRIQQMVIHAGDGFATVTGTGLQQVTGGILDGLPLVALGDVSGDGTTLRLSIDPDAALTAKKLRRTFKDGEHGTAALTLSDGRSLDATYTVDASRPSVVLLNRSVTSLPPANAGPATPSLPSSLPLTLTNKDAIPLRSKVTLALRTESPAKFSRSEKVEVGTTDGTLRTELTLANGGMVLQDNRTAIAMLEPEKAFGGSAFGPLQFRVVTNDAVSDWLPLGVLVRTPVIQQVACPNRTPTRAPVAGSAGNASGDVTAGSGDTATADLPCTLTGKDLFLIEAVSADAAFSAPVSLPEGFAQDSVRVPRPADGRTLYLRLRDDPTQAASLSIDPRSPASR